MQVLTNHAVKEALRANGAVEPNNLTIANYHVCPLRHPNANGRGAASAVRVNNGKSIQIDSDVVNVRSDIDRIVTVGPAEKIRNKIIRAWNRQVRLIVRDRKTRFDLG